MNNYIMPKIDLSKLNVEEFHNLRGCPALIKINRRVRGLFLPVDNEEEARELLELLYTPGGDNETDTTP